MGIVVVESYQSSRLQDREIGNGGSGFKEVGWNPMSTRRRGSNGSAGAVGVGLNTRICGRKMMGAEVK